MQTFRLIVNEKDTVVVRAPNQKKLQEYLNEPGDKGYKLVEILMSMYEVTDNLKIVDLEKITEADTIISWNVYQDENNDY